MEKITSFTIDHIKLQPGLYVSRKERVGAETVTTFDLRLTKPNDEPVMNTAEVHTIEHLAATFLRNDPDWKDRVLYFGPMGCRTGFYLLLAGDYTAKEIVPLVLRCFRFIRDYRGPKGMKGHEAVEFGLLDAADTAKDLAGGFVDLVAGDVFLEGVKEAAVRVSGDVMGRTEGPKGHPFLGIEGMERLDEGGYARENRVDLVLEEI